MTSLFRDAFWSIVENTFCLHFCSSEPQDIDRMAWYKWPPKTTKERRISNHRKTGQWKRTQSVWQTVTKCFYLTVICIKTPWLISQSCGNVTDCYLLTSTICVALHSSGKLNAYTRSDRTKIYISVSPELIVEHLSIHFSLHISDTALNLIIHLRLFKWSSFPGIWSFNQTFAISWRLATLPCLE